MNLSPLAGLDALLAPLPKDVSDQSRALLALLGQVQPALVGKVMPGWRSINFRHPSAGFVCAIFPHPDRLVLVFEHGRQLSQGEGLLEGDCNRVRYMTMPLTGPLPETAIALVLAEAIALFG